MTFTKVGTITVKGIVYISSFTHPSKVTVYNTSYYYYKFSVKIKNDSGSKISNWYVKLSGDTLKNTYTSSNFSISSGKTHTIDFLVPMADIKSKSASVYAHLYDSNDNEKYEYESSLTSRSPPTLDTVSPSLDKSSYKIGDTISAHIDVKRPKGDNVFVYSSYFLYDASAAHVTTKTTKDFELADTTKTTESYSDYTLKANSYTLGNWIWEFYTYVGWSDDTVYTKKGLEKGHFYTKLYSNVLTASVKSSASSPELKLGSKSQHKIPSTITKGLNTQFQIYVINTYSNDKTIQLQIRFEKDKTTSYTHTSSTMTAKANTSKLYSVIVNIPLSYTGNGTNDVYVNLCENKC